MNHLTIAAIWLLAVAFICLFIFAANNGNKPNFYPFKNQDNAE